MKALTICQPYAELICRGDKFVENRTWETSYRGPLAIHAGKSRAWLMLSGSGKRDARYDILVSDMRFGAVVAIATLADCLHISKIRADVERYARLNEHEHTEGPYCWVLESIATLPAPVLEKGSQGLWNWEPRPGLLKAIGMEVAR